MRRRALTLGLLLILVGVYVVEQGPQLLAPLAGIAGLSTHYTQENVVLSPTLYSVPATNYSFLSADLQSGSQIVGSLQVADERQVAFYVMNEGNFSLWRSGRPAALVLAKPLAISYNFTLSPTSSGTYYFVFDNEDNSPHAVIFSLSSIQDVVVLSPFVQYAGFESLFLGVVFCYFGLRGGGRKKEAKEEARQETMQGTVQTFDSGWKCRFCGASNAEDQTFCAKCGRAQN